VSESSVEGLKAWTHVIYGLHAFSVLAGIVTPAFIVTAFLLGFDHRSHPQLREAR